VDGLKRSEKKDDKRKRRGKRASTLFSPLPLHFQPVPSSRSLFTGFWFSVTDEDIKTYRSGKNYQKLVQELEIKLALSFFFPGAFPKNTVSSLPEGPEDQSMTIFIKEDPFQYYLLLVQSTRNICGKHESDCLVRTVGGAQEMLFFERTI